MKSQRTHMHMAALLVWFEDSLCSLKHLELVFIRVTVTFNFKRSICIWAWGTSALPWALSISCHVFYNCTYLFHPHYEGRRILLGLSILLTSLFLHSYTFLMLLLLCSTSRCILAMTVNCLSFFSTLFCYIYIKREGFTTEREGGHRQADRNWMTISLLSVSLI